MASPPVLPVAELLAPLSQGGPSGINLRSVGGNPDGRALYDAIRGARSQARLKEKPQILGDPAAPSGPPDEWRTVLDKSILALSTRSKDLEIATYLIEAAVRYHQFAGLRDSFLVYRSLVSQYWDSLYPALDDDGVGGRVSGLGSLNGDATREGALLFPISRVALTDGNGAKFGLFHYQCAVAIDKLPPERQEERVRAGQCNIKMFDDSVKRTPIDTRKNVLEDLTQCLDEFDRLVEELTTRCALDAPSSSRIREALQECQRIVEKVGVPLAMGDPSGGTAAGDAKTAPKADSGGGTLTEVPATFRNREEAFDVVLRVADFFRKTEPLSPVIFSLEQAVRWGRMPLPALLTELIQDESARRSLFQLVGIRPPPAEGQNQ